MITQIELTCNGDSEQSDIGFSIPYWKHNTFDLALFITCYNLYYYTS